MVVVDANILLELIENRVRADKVRSTIEEYENADEKLSTSTLSLSHAFYLAEAHKVPLNRVERFAVTYQIFGVIAADVEWALAQYKGKDFEDALQVAAALREQCSAFLTLDSSLAVKYRRFLPVKLIR